VADLDEDRASPSASGSCTDARSTSWSEYGKTSSRAEARPCDDEREAPIDALAESRVKTLADHELRTHDGRHELRQQKRSVVRLGGEHDGIPEPSARDRRRHMSVAMWLRRTSRHRAVDSTPSSWRASTLGLSV
jgi:hypothetical protein